YPIRDSLTLYVCNLFAHQWRVNLSDLFPGFLSHGEIELELDGIRDAQHNRHARLVDREILNRERSRRFSGEPVRLELRVHLPRRRMSYATHGEITNDFESL